MKARKVIRIALLVASCSLCLAVTAPAGTEGTTSQRIGQNAPALPRITQAFGDEGDLSAAQTKPAKSLGSQAGAKASKPSKAQLKAFKKASADFSMKLFARCVAAKGKSANVTVAPLSVLNALAVTANGAGGRTSAQMRKVLGGGASMARINKNLAWYNGRLVNAKKARLLGANSIWYHDDPALKISGKFIKKAQRYYNAEVNRADFADPRTVDSINKWVADHTNNMIKRVVSQLEPTDRIAIANALYFDAEWLSPYTKQDVRKRAFTCASGKKRKVDMMHSVEHSYIEGKNVTGFVKPYAKGYSYVALLPKKGVSLKSFVSTLSGNAFRKLVSSARTETVYAALPKYSVSYTNEAMQNQLRDMGMTLAFSDGANFSKMGSDATGNLVIGSVVHKTKVEVDEQGTKAAAATVVVVKANAGFSPDPKSVVLNRPFVYAIVDNATKLPVFIGTVNSIGE